MTAAASENRPVQPSIAAAHYEVLRRAALGEALPVEARSGLVLFLRRGMWGWARALAAATTPAQTIRWRSSTPATADEHRAVIHVFAAMAMNIHERRTR